MATSIFFLFTHVLGVKVVGNSMMILNIATINGMSFLMIKRADIHLRKNTGKRMFKLFSFQWTKHKNSTLN